MTKQRKPNVGRRAEWGAMKPASACGWSTDRSLSDTGKMRNSRSSTRSDPLASAGMKVKMNWVSRFTPSECSLVEIFFVKNTFSSTRCQFCNMIVDRWNSCPSIGLTWTPLSGQWVRRATYICVCLYENMEGADCTCGSTSKLVRTPR